MKLSMFLLSKELSQFLQTPSDDLEECLTQCKLWYPGLTLSSDILYYCDGKLLEQYEGTWQLKGMHLAVKGPVAPSLCRRNHLLQLNDETELIPCFNHCLEVFHRYAELEQQMADVICKNGTVQNLVDLVTPLSGNEIIVMNSNFKIIASSYESISLLSASGLPQPSEAGLIPLELANYFRNDTIYKNVEKIKEPFYYEESIFSRRVLCINVFLQHEFASRIVLCEVNRIIDSADEQLLKILARYVQLVYDRQGLDTTNLSPSALVSVLWKLLYESPLKEDEYSRALMEYQWDNNDQYLCFCVKLQGNSGTVRSIPYYCAQFNNNLADTFSLEYGRYIVGTVNLSKCTCGVDTFLQRMSALQKEANFLLGYSEVFYNLKQLKVYYHQAEIALEIGIQENSTLWRHGFGQYYFSYIKDKLTEDIPPELHIPREIKLLRQYDLNNETTYVDTLRTYLEKRMNAVQTAEALYIHRATMVYRLKRIQEIAGIDFEDNQLIFRLCMAFELFLA